MIQVDPISIQLENKLQTDKNAPQKFKKFK